MALAVVRGRQERSRARLAAQKAAPKIPEVLQGIVRRGTTGDRQKRLGRVIFMIFTAYFDESGTHAGAELTPWRAFLETPDSGESSRNGLVNCSSGLRSIILSLGSTPFW